MRATNISRDTWAPSDLAPAGVRAAALAGIVGPVLFTLAFLAQGALRRAEYSPVAEPVSALEAGPNGWVQQVNFVVFGVLLLAFAVGLNRSEPRHRPGAAGYSRTRLARRGFHRPVPGRRVSAS